MLTQQPKGQLQSEHEWKKQTHIMYRDKAIYNIWVIMMVIKIIITKSKLSIRSDGRSQRPRGLRHKMSWPAWTLGLWVRIPLDAWMSVCVYAVFVLSCVSSGLATGWSLVQGDLPTVSKCKITEPHKEEAKARYALKRHIRIIIIRSDNNSNNNNNKVELSFRSVNV
jgi:hypothetical protein